MRGSQNGRGNKAEELRRSRNRDKIAAGLRKKRAQVNARESGREGRSFRPRIADVVDKRDADGLDELVQFWVGSNGEGRAAKAGDARSLVAERMARPDYVAQRIAGLGRRLNQVFELHLQAPGYQQSYEELAASKTLSYLSEFELEASLLTLQRHGLLQECADARYERYGGRVFAVPEDLADGVVRLKREKRRGVFDLLTLRGYLDRLYDDPERARRTPPTRVRELYKMYAAESAAVARVERLPDGLRGLVEKAVMQFGGVLPKGLFERMESDLPHWNPRRWRMILEESLIGTVDRLELSRYGIHHADDTLIVFNEVTLAWLKRVAVPGDPDQPHNEASLGVDVVANVSRFIGFILEHNVRFTVRGEIFKTTEKRILQELIPNPGRELQRSEVLSFIYAFTRFQGLIESTGERTFSITLEGRQWEQRGLDAKLQAMLDFALDERELSGDFYHQSRMRRILIRLLKRVESDTWYDLMYLPFLARNTYLASLDQLAVDEYFGQRGDGGHYTPMEDPQRLAWNLTKWVRQRLYLLGLIDLGYDASDRPVALRLTRQGARLLGVVGGGPDTGPAVGSIVVTPDFEVVLFPTGDDAELVHELDRFCTREKKGETLHFRISERSVQRALSEGMHLSRILGVLRGQSRTPVPQNVLFSIGDWAHRAGLMTLDSNGVLSCRDLDALRRFQQDAGTRPYVTKGLDENRVQLKQRYSMKRTQSLLRDLGYLVEYVG